MLCIKLPRGCLQLILGSGSDHQSQQDQFFSWQQLELQMVNFGWHSEQLDHRRYIRGQGLPSQGTIATYRITCNNSGCNRIFPDRGLHMAKLKQAQPGLNGEINFKLIQCLSLYSGPPHSLRLTGRIGWKKSLYSSCTRQSTPLGIAAGRLCNQTTDQREVVEPATCPGRGVRV